MNTLRRKKIIIISITSAILLVALVLGGVYAYTATDLFKSNQTLFFKYAGQAIDNLKYVENKQLAEIGNLMEESPYKVTGELSTTSNGNPVKVAGIEAKIDSTEETTYAKMDLFANNQNLFALEYANSNNIYALKSEEIANAFIGFENENLKVLAQKLGISDVSNVPDSIDFKTTNKEMTDFTDEELKHIYETYLPVLQKSIPEDKFKKDGDVTISKEGTSYKATGYRVNLTQKELRDITVAFLETLKEDSITLNMITTRAKALEMGDDYTEINKITKNIENAITKLNNSNVTDEAVISITIYVDNGQVLETEIILSNRYKLIVYGTSSEASSKRYISYEDLNRDNSKTEITETETRQKEKSTYDIILKIGKNDVSINMTNTGSASSKELATTIELEITAGQNTMGVQYEQEMIFDDELEIMKLDRTNCAVLNDYTTEQLQALVQQLAERIQTVVNEKAQTLSNTFNNTRETSNNGIFETEDILRKSTQGRENYEAAARFENEQLANLEAWTQQLENRTSEI